MVTANWTVERSTTIDTTPGRVYDQIVNFRNWQHWSPWEDVDPALHRNYSGAQFGPGAVYTWKGNRKAGEGRMEIVEAVDPRQVAVDVDFLKPFKSSSRAVFTLTPAADDEATHVAWSMSGRNNLMLRAMGFFTSMDKLIGPDFEKGLSRLKAYAEGRTHGS